MPIPVITMPIPVITMADLGDHDADLGDHDAPKPALLRAIVESRAKSRRRSFRTLRGTGASPGKHRLKGTVPRQGAFQLKPL
jgi:hypothetical protein